jgi:hypothetical protein
MDTLRTVAAGHQSQKSHAVMMMLPVTRGPMMVLCRDSILRLLSKDGPLHCASVHSKHMYEAQWLTFSLRYRVPKPNNQ